jgi:hypothetical protein
MEKIIIDKLISFSIFRKKKKKNIKKFIYLIYIFFKVFILLNKNVKFIKNFQTNIKKNGKLLNKKRFR